MKFKALFESPIDSKKIRNLAQQYKTYERRFDYGFWKNLTATDYDLKIKVDRFTSEDFLEI